MLGIGYTTFRFMSIVFGADIVCTWIVTFWDGDQKELVGEKFNYTSCSEKSCHYIFASNSAKCWPIFKILLPTDLAVNFWKSSE